MNNVKSFATASAVAAAAAAVGAKNRNHHNSHASPLRLSPGPDTPSITSGGAGGSSSSSSSSSSGSSCSSGVGSSAGKMQNISVNNQQTKMGGPSGDLSLHELGDALDHGSRMRKASSMPPQVAIGGAIQSPNSHSPPVWVPR